MIFSAAAISHCYDSVYCISQKELQQFWIPEARYNNSERQQLLCPALRPSLFLTSPILLSIPLCIHLKKLPNGVFGSFFSSVTYHHQPQSGFSQWQKINILGGDKICPPCCRGYCCRHTAELTFERIRLPHRTHSFSSSRSYLCWGKWEKGIKNEEGREQDYID